MDMSLCLEASDVCAVNEGDCGWVWEWRAGHFGMCSSWPRKWPGCLCLLLESLWTWALPTSLGKLRPKALSNAEFSTDKLEWSLLNSADGVIVWDVESDLQLFLFRDVDRSKVFIDFFFFFWLGGMWDQTHSPYIGRWSLHHWATRESPACNLEVISWVLPEAAGWLGNSHREFFWKWQCGNIFSSRFWI